MKAMRFRVVLSAMALACAPVPAARAATSPSSFADRTVAALSRFTNVSDAQHAGYRLVSTNGRIAHYLNPRFASTGVRPQTPQGLVYGIDATGEHLLAALFMLPAAVRRPPRFTPVGSWHDHRYCEGGGGYGVPTPNGPCPLNTHATQTPLMLHVWRAAMPGGRFARAMEPLRWNCSVAKV